MQAFIGATLITSKEAQPQTKPFEIYDNRLVVALTLRLQWEDLSPMWRYPIDFKMEREGLEPSTPAL
jgi:hypothetical protein